MEKQREAPKNILNVVKYLRSSLKNRQGILNGKRVDYFKGKSAVKALLKESYGKLKEVPKVTSENEAHEVLQEVLSHAFFLLVERSESGSRKKLDISSFQSWREDQYYAWFYEGSQLMTILMGIGLISIVFAAVLFPLWPSILRDAVWYVSVGVLSLFGVFIILAVVRLILYIITMIVIPPGIWLFPNLFEDVGVIESFIPLWGWELPKKKEKTPEDEGDGKEYNEAGENQKNRDLRTTVEDGDDEERYEKVKDDDDKKDD